MAAGEAYYNCENSNESLMQTFRKMIYDDGTGKPVLILSGNTALQNWFDCRDKRKNIETEQVLRQLIVKDAQGNPTFNVR